LGVCNIASGIVLALFVFDAYGKSVTKDETPIAVDENVMSNSNGERNDITGSLRRNDAEFGIKDNSIPDNDAVIRTVVNERLQNRRKEKRVRFVDTLVLRVEAIMAHSIPAPERASLEQKNLEYFAAIDSARASSQDSGDAEVRERVSRVRKERIETLGEIVGSEKAATRILEETMNGLVTE
jgi:hypothetical protein